MANQRISIHDSIFELCKNKGSDCIHLDKFYEQLESNGILKDDFRLKGINEDLQSHDEVEMDLEKFKKITEPHEDFMDKVFNKKFIIPHFKEFTKTLEEIYKKCKSNDAGNNADYIPELSSKVVNKNNWGVAVCTTDNQRASFGNADTVFTIQSCSKPLTYAVARESLPADVVHKYVGKEPSGRVFNEIVLDRNGLPHNPMINAGAMMTATIVKHLIRPTSSWALELQNTRKIYDAMAGQNSFGFNGSVFHSEREVAFRNYALAFYMREKNLFPKGTNLRESCDFYFQLCSLTSTASHMAIVAATLANGGVCPTTKKVVLKPETVRDVLSLMQSCGMYDYSGKFAFKVGLPAKSGVGGAVMVVVPDTCGFCTYSPPLDDFGNSVRGVMFYEELVKVFNLHPYDNLRHTTTKINPRRSSIYEC